MKAVDWVLGRVQHIICTRITLESKLTKNLAPDGPIVYHSAAAIAEKFRVVLDQSGNFIYPPSDLLILQKAPRRSPRLQAYVTKLLTKKDSTLLFSEPARQARRDELKKIDQYGTLKPPVRFQEVTEVGSFR